MCVWCDTVCVQRGTDGCCVTVCPEGVGWVCGVMLSVWRGVAVCVCGLTLGVCVSGWGWIDVCVI